MIRRVLIVGTGLIGASAGLALRAAGFDGEIIGTGPTAETLKIARDLGAIDAWRTRADADAAAATSDVILLAGPVFSILDWMQRLAPVLGEHQLVTDVGSTKLQIAELAAKIYNQPGKARFLPGHPMAGKESGGAALAEATLFQNAMWLFTPAPGADPSELETEWREWVAKFGARTMDLDAVRHDEICAWVSHLPQMTDPGADLVMTHGIEVHRACSKLCHPLAPFRFEFRGISARRGREEPHRILEECGLCQCRAARFLARHWMAGKEACFAGLVVDLRSQFCDLQLGAANVGDELMFAQHGSESLHPIENREYWSSKQNHVGGRGGCVGVGACTPCIDSSKIPGDLQRLRGRAGSDDLTIKAGSAQGEAC